MIFTIFDCFTEHLQKGKNQKHSWFLIDSSRWIKIYSKMYSTLCANTQVLVKWKFGYCSVFRSLKIWMAMISINYLLEKLNGYSFSIFKKVWGKRLVFQVTVFIWSLLKFKCKMIWKSALKTFFRVSMFNRIFLKQK